MFANKGAVTKVTGIDSTDASGVTLTSVVSSVNGQINTPITRYGDYIYFGTWSGNSAMPYYQVKISDSSFTVKTANGGEGERGFYWAGAVSDGDYVFYGSDNGVLYWQSVSNFGEND